MDWAFASLGLLSLFLIGGVIGLWIGVSGLGRARRDAAWGLMLAGNALLTVGPLATILTTVLLANSYGSSGRSPLVGARILTSMGPLAVVLGMILFCIGFALHGMRAARSQERLKELELLTQAMDQEITRLKEGASRP